MDIDIQCSSIKNSQCKCLEYLRKRKKVGQAEQDEDGKAVKDEVRQKIYNYAIDRSR